MNEELDHHVSVYQENLLDYEFESAILFYVLKVLAYIFLLESKFILTIPHPKTGFFRRLMDPDGFCCNLASIST